MCLDLVTEDGIVLAWKTEAVLVCRGSGKCGVDKKFLPCPSLGILGVRVPGLRVTKNVKVFSCRMADARVSVVIAVKG